MTAKQIASTIPALSAVALAGHNLAKVKKKKISAKDMIGLGATNLVGVALIRAQAQAVGDL